MLCSLFCSWLNRINDYVSTTIYACNSRGNRNLFLTWYMLFTCMGARVYQSCSIYTLPWNIIIQSNETLWLVCTFVWNAFISVGYLSISYAKQFDFWSIGRSFFKPEHDGSIGLRTQIVIVFIYQPFYLTGKHERQKIKLSTDSTWILSSQRDRYNTFLRCVDLCKYLYWRTDPWPIYLATLLIMWGLACVYWQEIWINQHATSPMNGNGSISERVYVDNYTPPGLESSIFPHDL